MRTWIYYLQEKWPEIRLTFPFFGEHVLYIEVGDLLRVRSYNAKTACMRFDITTIIACNTDIKFYCKLILYFLHISDMWIRQPAIVNFCCVFEICLKVLGGRIVSRVRGFQLDFNAARFVAIFLRAVAR